MFWRYMPACPGSDPILLSCAKKNGVGRQEEVAQRKPFKRVSSGLFRKQKGRGPFLFPFIGTQTVTPVEREWRDPLPPALFSALCRERNDLAQWRKDFRLLLVRLHGAVHQTDIPVDDADSLAGIAGVFHISFSGTAAAVHPAY